MPNTKITSNNNYSKNRLPGIDVSISIQLGGKVYIVTPMDDQGRPIRARDTLSSLALSSKLKLPTKEFIQKTLLGQFATNGSIKQDFLEPGETKVILSRRDLTRYAIKDGHRIDVCEYHNQIPVNHEFNEYEKHFRHLLIDAHNIGRFILRADLDPQAKKKETPVQQPEPTPQTQPQEEILFTVAGNNEGLNLTQEQQEQFHLIKDIQKQIRESIDGGKTEQQAVFEFGVNLREQTERLEALAWKSTMYHDLQTTQSIEKLLKSCEFQANILGKIIQTPFASTAPGAIATTVSIEALEEELKSNNPSINVFRDALRTLRSNPELRDHELFASIPIATSALTTLDTLGITHQIMEATDIEGNVNTSKALFEELKTEVLNTQ